MHDEDDMLGDFDPYQTIMDMSDAIDMLIVSHNLLVDDYAKAKKRLTSLEDRMLQLEILMIHKDLE